MQKPQPLHRSASITTQPLGSLGLFVSSPIDPLLDVTDLPASTTANSVKKGIIDKECGTLRAFRTNYSTRARQTAGFQ